MLSRAFDFITSHMYHIERGQKPEAAKPQNDKGKWRTKMTTGSTVTPKGTTVVYLGTNPKPHTLTKSISLTEYFQAARSRSTDKVFLAGTNSVWHQH